jgi:hypothetical protein
MEIEQMARTFRRIVTGNSKSGHSMLVEDSEIRETGGVGNFDFWMTATNMAGVGSLASFPFFPRTGQTIFRIFRIPPDDPSTTADDVAEIAAGFFAEVGDPSCKVDTSRHPLMHRTPTTDYVTLLSGEAALLLDDGDPIPLHPFDAVVQRGTNHVWLNTGREDAVFLVVMLGAGQE